MGSPKVSNAKPQTMDNKSFKTLSLIKSFFHKDKKKEKARERELADKKNELKSTKTDNTAKEPETTVACILEPFKKLEINTNKKQIVIKNDQDIVRDKNDEEDELDDFTFKVIEEDRRSARIDSQSSQDSGYSEMNHEVVETLEKLTIHDKTESETNAINNKEIRDEINNETKDKTDEHKKEKDNTETKEDKKKRLHQVVVKRTPIRAKVSDYSIHPYAKGAENSHRPISQINKQTLSGGQVIVNPTPTDFSELDVALNSVAEIYHSDPAYWEDVLDVISNDNIVDDVLSEFSQIYEIREYSIDVIPEKIPSPNPIEEFSTHLSSYEESEFANSILPFGNYPKTDSSGIFPTPPRSVPSPLSESQAFYASNSEYTLSPARSSPVYNSDFEKYQEISPLSYDEEEKEIKRDRASSISQSSMTMKNFKDLQKEISNGFSKKDCCDINRKSCKEIFEEHMQKLKTVERKNLCLKVSKLDLKTSYGVLHHILLSLSKECDQEDLQYALFALVCQRVLAQTPALFAGDFGLSILKAAALRCPNRPLLTRYIVQCVYLVLRSDPKLCTNECVFHEVDAQGDNLVIACARGGDAYAPVLAEITRDDQRGDLPPLFRLHHANSDGYSALHVACRMHSTSNPRLFTVHVLLDHANADIWKGDIKGGDTPLHLAVNSSTCCLKLVMMLFKHQDRKLWKKLAHAQNMSSVTPLEYARSATKSTTRQNYPHEVLDFLKKCR